ncbi:hypothetical protein [Winogradskyella pacifica]|uniref:hypothetical protein n=1 Tax=Winogradskyella pacifica TaxID=664642 RepID=UPI0015CB2924|nr:hypothetical protein [Winogradskyella pacifica]
MVLLIHHLDWQKTFYICASFGAVATALSLIYLFIKDYNKSNKISHLERVAEILTKDLELKYQPHLWLNVVALRGGENRIDFDINNKREWCKLLDFQIISGDLVCDEGNKHLPFELEPKFDQGIINETNRRWIFMINNSEKSLNDVVYEFNIIYEDRLMDRYSITAKGKGGACRLASPIKIT